MRRISIILMVVGGVLLAAMMCFQFFGDREGHLGLPIGILMFVLAVGFVMFLIYGFAPPPKVVEEDEDEEDADDGDESVQKPPQ